MTQKNQMSLEMDLDNLQSGISIFGETPQGQTESNAYKAQMALNRIRFALEQIGYVSKSNFFPFNEELENVQKLEVYDLCEAEISKFEVSHENDVEIPAGKSFVIFNVEHLDPIENSLTLHKQFYCIVPLSDDSIDFFPRLEYYGKQLVWHLTKLYPEYKKSKIFYHNQVIFDWRW